jgi:ribonuclease HI
LNRFSKYSILYIPREENRRADQLANEAIDQKNDK